MVSMVTSSPLAIVRTGFSVASKKPQWQVSGLEMQVVVRHDRNFLAGLVVILFVIAGVAGNPSFSNKAVVEMQG